MKLPGKDSIYFDKSSNKIKTFPRIGAFEIKVFDLLIYSKLCTRLWPSLNYIIQTIKNLQENSRKGF